MTNNTQEQINALVEEFKPRFIALFKTAGIEIDENISTEEFLTLLSDQKAFEALLPEGTSVYDLPPAFLQELQSIGLEFVERLLAVGFTGIFG